MPYVVRDMDDVSTCAHGLPSGFFFLLPPHIVFVMTNPYFFLYRILVLYFFCISFMTFGRESSTLRSNSAFFRDFLCHWRKRGAAQEFCWNASSTNRL